jgi:hypothetical protein
MPRPSGGGRGTGGEGGLEEEGLLSSEKPLLLNASQRWEQSRVFLLTFASQCALDAARRTPTSNADAPNVAPSCACLRMSINFPALAAAFN